MRNTLLALTMVFGLSLSPVPGHAAPLAPVVHVRDQLRHASLDDAVEAADEVIETLPQDANAWMWAGRVYGRQAQEANILTKAKWAGRCRDAFEKAVELDPNLIEARFDLMQFYLLAPGIMGGGRDKANAQAAAIAAIDPASSQIAAGSLALQDKDEVKAEQLFRDALAGNPAHVRALFELNSFLQNKKRFDEAWAVWNAALAEAEVQAMARYQLGRLAAITGQHVEEGLTHLDAFIAAGIVPEQLTLAAAHWRRGLLLDKLGRREDAIAALQLALNDRDIGEQAQADLNRIRKG